MHIMVLKEAQALAETLGVNIEEIKRVRRDVLAHKYLDLMLAATYAEAGEGVRAEYRETASRVLAIALREEDTLFIGG